MAQLLDDGRQDCDCTGCGITRIRMMRWERQRQFRPDLPPPQPWGPRPSESIQRFDAEHIHDAFNRLEPEIALAAL
jgi:hypothetical protein